MSTRSAKPRHRARRGITISAILATASALAATTLVVSASASGTYALWNDSKNFTGPTIQSGTLGMLINGQSTTALGAAGWNNMLPGDKTRLQVTIANNGTVGATVVARTTGASSDLEVRVQKGACPAVALTGADTIPAVVSLGTWTAGESSAACVEVTLKPAATVASKGASLPFTLTITGTQAP